VRCSARVLHDTRAAKGAQPALATDWQTFQKTVHPFLTKHCFECHTDKESGGVRLDQFKDEKALRERLPTVEKVLDTLGKRAMPPKKRTQLGEDERKPVLAWLEAYVERTEQESARSNRVRVRRLNRAEYNNTVRDSSPFSSLGKETAA
jgi:mono/diheme cytochrome c family protein